MKKLKFAACLLACLFSGCYSTQKLTSWSIQHPPSQLMSKVLVVGITEDKEERIETEEAIARKLQAAGIDAFSAIDQLGMTGFHTATGKELSSWLETSSYTAVMLVSFINKEKELRVASYYGRPHYQGSHRYYRRYWTLYDTLYTPGYYNASFDYLLEVEFIRPTILMNWFTVHKSEPVYPKIFLHWRAAFQNLSSQNYGTKACSRYMQRNKYPEAHNHNSTKKQK